MSGGPAFSLPDNNNLPPSRSLISHMPTCPWQHAMCSCPPLLPCAQVSGQQHHQVNGTVVCSPLPLLQAFKGIWRMQAGPGSGPPGSSSSTTTTLMYSLFVRPHPWLPVKLIEDRISSEVVNNLKAVRQHTERVHKQRQQQQAGALSSTASSDSSSTTIQAT